MLRRDLIRNLTGGSALALVGDCPFAGAQSAGRSRPAQTRKSVLGFKQYGMKNIPVREAINHIGKLGYKALSLTLMPTWDTEPKLLSKPDRVEIRKRISDLGLTLSTVMESLRPLPVAGRERNLERLRAA